MSNYETAGTELQAAFGVITLQFDRTDGMIPSPPDCFERLRSLSRETLQSIGCVNWGGTGLMLFPEEWYDYIPDGYMLKCIDGTDHEFKYGITDDDRRFGCLAYGIEASQ